MPLRLLLPLALLLASALPATAQDGTAAQSGSLLVADWPQSAVEAGLLSAEQVEEAVLLPDVKALRLGYELVDASGGPRLFVQLTWEHGHFGRLDGERVAYEVLPEETRLAALELHARVVRGEAVADFYVALDDLNLAAAPALYEATVETLAWSDLFPQLSPDSARSLLAQGFTLEQPQILSATFTPGDDGFYTQVADTPGRDQPQRREPAPTVVTVDPGVWIDIWIYSPPRSVYDRPQQTPSRPRGALTRGAEDAESSDGRSTPGRRAGAAERDNDGETRGRNDDRTSRADTSESRGRGLSDLFGGKKDEDDDEDDDSLLPAALVGVAAVGMLAYAGGTIGYYGNAGEAPFGLSAGYVRRGGGVLLQVAVNDAVVNRRDAPEHLIAKMTAFLDAFDAPLQPALGLGVYAEEYRGDHDLSPSVSLGGVWQHGPGVFYLGYDVVADGVDVGLAFNFRHRRTGSTTR